MLGRFGGKEKEFSKICCNEADLDEEGKFFAVLHPLCNRKRAPNNLPSTATTSALMKCSTTTIHGRK